VLNILGMLNRHNPTTDRRWLPRQRNLSIEPKLAVTVKTMIISFLSIISERNQQVAICE